MSLYKRSKIWWCKWRIGGAEVRETTGTTDREKAQEYHDRRRSDLWRKTRLGDTRIATWDEAALDWVDEHAQHKRSYETDRTRLLWLTGELTGQSLASITTDSLLAIRKKLLKRVKASTANRHMAIVSAVMRHAHAKTPTIPLPKIPYLPEPKERFRWLTREQAQALIDELPDHLGEMARFALATGLRRGNVTGLTWNSLDTTRRIAWIWPDEAKAGKPIAVPLNGDALAVLQRRKGIDARYVFTYRKRPILHTTTKAWVLACERAEIEPGFKFHDLRHTWASWHVMGGTPLEVLQKLGGWADLSMVQRYAHLAPGYVAGYAENSAMGTKLGTEQAEVSEDYREELGCLGWTMGLEPTTTGITILTGKKKRA